LNGVIIVHCVHTKFVYTQVESDHEGSYFYEFSKVPFWADEICTDLQRGLVHEDLNVDCLTQSYPVADCTPRPNNVFSLTRGQKVYGRVSRHQITVTAFETCAGKHNLVCNNTQILVLNQMEFCETIKSIFDNSFYWMR